MMMRLRIFLPSQIYLTEETGKIIGRSISGEFCLLPRHRDYVTALPPGILAHYPADGTEKFLAVDGGILVKQGQEILLAAGRVVAGGLGELEQEVATMLASQDQQEKKTMASIARLEAGFLRRFLEFRA